MEDELSRLIGSIAEAASLSARSRGLEVEPYFALVSGGREIMVTAFEPGYLQVVQDKSIMADTMKRLIVAAQASSAGFGMTCGMSWLMAGDEVGRRRIERFGVDDRPVYVIWVTDGIEERIFFAPVDLVGPSSARLPEWELVRGEREGGILAEAVKSALLNED